MWSLAQRITTAREAVGLSKAELARRIGVSKSAVSQWENGETKNIRLSNFLQLCYECNRPPEWFVGKNTKMEYQIAEVVESPYFINRDINNLFNALNDEGKAELLGYAEAITKNPKYLPPPTSKTTDGRLGQGKAIRNR